MRLIVFLLVACSPLMADRKPPNIVFFFTDDQTTSTIGCYGNEVIKTPHIDSLAKRGTRFENAFVSHPICWASRASILTGLTARSYRTPGNPDQVRPEIAKELYSDILRTSNYRTGYFGKWHARMPKGFRNAEHFDEFEAIGRDPFYKKMPDGSVRHETELIVDRGIEFLKSQPADKPFALNMWFNACHAEDNDRRPGVGHFPWPKAVNGMYDDLDLTDPRLNDPEIFAKLPDFLQTSITRERYFWRWNTPERYQTNIRAYYRMVSGIDNAIGRFLKALEEAGLADNTIVVYSADNGYHMANRGLAGKWSHYEESIRVPLIIADPRVDPSQHGKVTDAPALNIDFPATFLDWAGLEVPKRYDGRSLQKIVSGKTPDNWRQSTFHEHWSVRHRIPAYEGVRGPRFKYVRYVDHNHEFLHDLENDPDELVNLADSDSHAEILAEMRRQTDSHVASMGGPLAPPRQPFQASTVPYPESAAWVVARPNSEGWSNLFNGNNLRGWDGDPKHWSVKEGAITGVTDGSLKMNRFLTWKAGTVQNFELEAMVKVSARGNSGLQYRGAMRPEFGLDVVSGYQCDIMPKPVHQNGMLYEERGRRVLARAGEKVTIDPQGRSWITGTFPVEPIEPDKWHRYRVVVNANHHQHWINGNKTTDVIDLDLANRASEGVLAMQVHVGPAMTIQFKDLRLRHLPDDLPLLTLEDHPIPNRSRGVRPQGTPEKGWRPPLYHKQED